MSDTNPGAGHYQASDGKWYAFDDGPESGARAPGSRWPGVADPLEPPAKRATSDFTTDEILRAIGVELKRARVIQSWILFLVLIAVGALLLWMFGAITIEFKPLR